MLATKVTCVLQSECQTLFYARFIAPTAMMPVETVHLLVLSLGFHQVAAIRLYNRERANATNLCS